VNRSVRRQILSSVANFPFIIHMIFFNCTLFSSITHKYYWCTWSDFLGHNWLHRVLISMRVPVGLLELVFGRLDTLLIQTVSVKCYLLWLQCCTFYGIIFCVYFSSHSFFDIHIDHQYCRSHFTFGRFCICRWLCWKYEHRT